MKELPKELQSLDLEAIGSVVSPRAKLNILNHQSVCSRDEFVSTCYNLFQVTDADIPKEAKPSFYLKNILPILLKNGVVHFLGFGHRLAFDPIPFQLQVHNKLLKPYL